jgi:hypothetical protein
MLRTKGALSISDDNLVQEYEDKPHENTSRFNAFWTSFAFKKRTFDECIEFMEKSTLRHKVLVDEGTWPEIYKFLNENYN